MHSITTTAGIQLTYTNSYDVLTIESVSPYIRAQINRLNITDILKDYRSGSYMIVLYYDSGTFTIEVEDDYERYRVIKFIDTGEII